MRTALPEITDESFLRFCDENFNEGTANFIKLQLSLTRKNPNGFRYNDEFKQFALTIYMLGPKVYRTLARTFHLPSKATLCRITHRWKVTPGFSDFIFGVVNLKVATLSDVDKDCLLCADEISLKTNLFYNTSQDEIIGFHCTDTTQSYYPANSALVLMARGIHTNWKQPVAYFFVKNCCPVEDLKNIVCEAIARLTNLGLNVLGFISDQGPNFQKLSRSLGVTTDKTYFLVNGKNFFYLFDTPHLLKSTRNHFITKNMIIEEGTTDMAHVRAFYQRDKQQTFRQAPKLTESHINPNNFEKMKVKYAAQLLSASVAAGVNTYIALSALPSSAIATATFISKMDELFDVLNSFSFKSSKFLNRPFTGEERQMQILVNMLKFFTTLRVCNENTKKDVTASLHFIKGWKITITSFLAIWDILKHKKKFLCSRQFNQDCLENFFGTVRQQGGNSLNPTPVQFSRAFKKLFCLKSFEFCEGFNCIQDLDGILCGLNSETFKSLQIMFQNKDTLSQSLSLDSTDYYNLTLPEENAIIYVSGYFLQKCFLKHSCELCLNYFKGRNELSSSNIFTYFRAYETKQNSTFGNLTMPSENFIAFIKNMDTLFCLKFSELSIQKGVGLKLKEELQKINFQCPCSKFDIDYLTCLFVRVRIFFTLKFFNRDFKTQKTGKKNNKMVNIKHL